MTSRISDIQNNHTIIDFSLPEFGKLDFSDKFVCLGSCFADEIADRLSDRSVDVLANPFGTIYNPISIYQCLYYNFAGEPLTTANLCYESGKFFSPYHSTAFDSENEPDALAKINDGLAHSSRFCADANVFIITYGTAVVYYYEKYLVANCHKLNASFFRREMLSVQTIKDTTTSIIDLILENVPSAKIIFTISPVRHKNHDLLTNSYSKALLKVGLESVLAECGNQNVVYFPSYEIAIDQLRDYTHYKPDGVHLTDTAVDYIYSRFENAFFTDETITTFSKLTKLILTLEHRSFDKSSLQYFDNLLEVYSQLEEIKKTHKSAKLDKLCFSVVKRMLKHFYCDEQCLNKIRATETFQENSDKFNKKLQKWSKS